MRRNIFCDDLRIYWIDEKVRITERVNITFRSVEACRNLQHANPCRRNNTSRRPCCNLRVTSALEKRWQPSKLELSASFDENIGAVERDDVRRLRIHEVRIFCRLRESNDAHGIAANFLCNR